VTALFKDPVRTAQ